MTALFTIRTANSSVGGANRFHSLDVREAIDDDNTFGAFVQVSVNYGDEEVYTFRPFILEMGDEHELITFAELERRRQVAREHGDEYDGKLGKDVWVVEWSPSAKRAYSACQRVITAFQAMSALDLFRLPVTF